MSPALHRLVTAPARLTGAQCDAMFALLARCYDHVTRTAFEADLASKTSVILLCDGDGTLRGFSTQQLYDWTWQGEPAGILFSGDTIVDPLCWGSTGLAKGWCAVAAQALTGHPRRRLFWFLLSKGFRTYLYLPVFFRHFIPSGQPGAPASWTALLDDLATHKFGSAWNPETGVIRFPESHGQLTPELAGIPQARLNDPAVQFFLKHNPDYQNGTELACLTEISPGNTHGLGKRWLERALQDLPPPAAGPPPGPPPRQRPGPPPPRSVRATVANTLWRAACEPARRRLQHALTHPAAAQAAVLRRILTTQAGTGFARSHGLHPDMHPPDYRQAVPVTGYDGHQSGIERMMAGEPDVLSAGRPDAFERSSGSTAAAKYLPLTTGLRGEFQEAVRAWMGDLLTRHPCAIHGPAWWIISPLRQPQETTAGGIPVGLATDDEYLGRWERRLASWLWAVPPAVARIPGLDENLDWTLRFLLQRPDLRLISVWNPSFLTLLWERFLTKPNTFLGQLAQGTGPADRPFLSRHLRAMPGHAAALQRIGGLTPQEVWPHLAVISGWSDGEAAPDAARVRRLFPHASWQPKGLLATEGVVTLPWGDDAAAGVPALHSHFLEFLEHPGGPARLVHELEQGRDYAVVLTTSGGLWRYQLGDLVRVDGRAGETPRLRFAGRCDDVCDLRGEKLHPGFVRTALGGFTSGFRLLAPCRGTDPPHYILFAATLRGTAAAADAALCGNPHYAFARAAGQLGPLRLFHVRDPDPSATFLRRCVSLGQRAGSVKMVCLHRASGWEDCFSGEFVTPAPLP